MPLHKGVLNTVLNKDYKAPDLSLLNRLDYCINVTDQVSGLQGSFAYDDDMYKKTGAHFAIGPVCMTVDALFDWCREKGFTVHCDEEMFCVKRPEV